MIIVMYGITLRAATYAMQPCLMAEYDCDGASTVTLTRVMIMTSCVRTIVEFRCKYAMVWSKRVLSDVSSWATVIPSPLGRRGRARRRARLAAAARAAPLPQKTTTLDPLGITDDHRINSSDVTLTAKSNITAD